VALVAVLFGPTGCALVGASSDSESHGTSASAKTSASLPAGHRWRTVEKVHVAFAAPDTWTAMDRTAVGKGVSGNPAVKELAKRTGMTVEQLQGFLERVDLYLAGPPADGFAPNLQAVVLPVAELPSDAAITQELGRVASSGPTLHHVRTAVGAGLDATFVIETAGKQIHSHSLILDTPDGVLDITVATLDEQASSSMVSTLLSSVHRV
jgi:hypothetical protein